MPFGFFYVLIWVAFLTTPESVSLDPVTWSEEDTTLADQTYLEEQATLQ